MVLSACLLAKGNSSVGDLASLLQLLYVNYVFLGDEYIHRQEKYMYICMYLGEYCTQPNEA